MSRPVPLATIGMPVYDGERFLERALNSIVDQSFDNFELIISDNGSTDRTEAICRHLASTDKRIRYYRNQRNIGLVKNYNRVFELSAGKYFKWAACDDLCAPDFLRRCIEILENEPGVILCYPKTTIIDEEDLKIYDYEDGLDLRSSLPHKRFRQFLRKPPGCNPVYGMMRRNVLCTTHLLRAFDASDYILLAEMCLRGQFWEVSERLFYRRSHPQMSRRAISSERDYAQWLDPSYRGRNYFPVLNVLFQLIKSVTRAPIRSYEKSVCLLEILDASVTLSGKATEWIRLRGVPFRMN